MRLGPAALLLACTLAVPASAQNMLPNRDTAGQLYEHAVEAHGRGEYARAAALFARADELAPDPVALEAAIGAALLANDAALAMSLVERSDRAPAPPSLAAAVRKARERFGDRVGVLVVRCTGCTVLVDGAPVRASERKWVPVGSHHVEVARGDALWSTDVIVAPSKTTEVTPAAPSDTTPAGSSSREGGAAPPDRPPGPSPLWFWAGAGLTVLAAGLAIASGLDTLSIHEDFVARPSRARAEEGRFAETRTYVLWGAAGALGVATAAVGLFVIDWSGGAWGGRRGGSAPAVAVSPAPGGVALKGRF